MGNNESQPKSGEEEPSNENSQNEIVVAKPPICDTKASGAKKILDSLHDWECIIKDANLAIDNTSPQKLLAKLQTGILLNQKRLKYSVDKMGKNCFMVYARDLYIIWGDDDSYWSWTQTNTTNCDEAIEVAELIEVCWLEVRGGFDIKKLSPGTLYEVSFVVKLEGRARGWGGNPVSLALCLPDGGRYESKVDMSTLQPREQWVKIPLGKFRTFVGHQGDLKFSLCQHGNWWKSGLTVKGVKIQPKI